MKKLTIEPAEPPAASEPCNGDLSAQFHRALSVLAGKWKGDILWQLVERKRRFGELRQSIPGVTQHMLTTQLRDLEANGLVKRTVYPEVPPRVEYEMTPSAKALAGDYMTTLRAGTEGDSSSADFRITVSTSTLWGIVGAGIIAAALLVAVGAVARFGRR